MNFLCNINQSFADLLINYLNLIKERSSCSKVFCKKVVLRNFAKFLRTPFFQGMPLAAASERVNADEAAWLIKLTVVDQITTKMKNSKKAIYFL